MTPETVPPGVVQLFQRMIFLPEPFPECTLALFTVAGPVSPVAAQLIGNMPQDHGRMLSETPGQLQIHPPDLLSHDR